MSIEKAKAWLAKYGLEDRVLEFEVSSATVELAAAALSCEPGRIAKTLSFMAGGQPMLIVFAGDARVDNGKFKARFSAKPRMMTAEELDACTGLRFGGVCPFGIPEAVPVYLDESLRRFDPVYPACGSSNSAIRISLEELERFSRAAGWVDVAKLPTNSPS